MQIIDKEDVLDFHREKIKKAYPAYFDTYKDISILRKHLNKYKNDNQFQKTLTFQTSYIYFLYYH